MNFIFIVCLLSLFFTENGSLKRLVLGKNKNMYVCVSGLSSEKVAR